MKVSELITILLQAKDFSKQVKISTTSEKLVDVDVLCEFNGALVIFTDEEE